MTDHDPLCDLWATDQGENLTMSIAELAARSNQFRSRIKRRNFTEYLAAALIICIFGWLAFIVPVWSVQIGAGLIIAAALYVSWQLNKRASVSSNTMLATDLVNFHRDELVRQRDALRSVWRWYLLPFVPGALVFTLGTTIEANADLSIWGALAVSAVQLGFGGAIFLGIWTLNIYAARRLDEKIKALDSVSVDM